MSMQVIASKYPEAKMAYNSSQLVITVLTVGQTRR